MVLVPMSMEATRLREVGSDFTTEFLGDDVRRQLGLKDFEGGAVIQIVGLDRGSRNKAQKELIRSLTGYRVDGQIKTVEILVIVIL